MCWSIPGKVESVNGNLATVELSGVTKEVVLDLVPEVEIGDYLLVHAGYALGKVDKEKAEFTIDFLKGNVKNA